MRPGAFRTVEKSVVECPDRASTENKQTHTTERSLGVASRSSCTAESVPLRQYAAPFIACVCRSAYFGPCFCALWRVFCMFSHNCLGSPILAALVRMGGYVGNVFCGGWRWRKLDCLCGWMMLSLEAATRLAPAPEGLRSFPKRDAGQLS
jgi:hypothetical protein